MIPYGRQFIDEDDISAVIEVLRSDWLTTGPKVAKFEEAFAKHVGARYAVAVNSGTAALHASIFAVGIKPGDEVIVPTITFAATANSVVYQGGTPVFADVMPSNLLIDPSRVEALITDRTRAIISVDYAGHPCDYDALNDIAARRGLFLIDDACHALGGSFHGRPVGSLAGLNTFSFHPVKHITTGEGGLVTTDDPSLASRMRLFRNHGIDSDHYQRELEGSWEYNMTDLGYNYRLTDLQCALGLSQLKKLNKWVMRRRAIASRYDAAFQNTDLVRPLAVGEGVDHAYHLYIVRVPGDARGKIFRGLRAEGIGVNVHYRPVHLHPFYRQRFGTGPGLCPNAEHAYEEIITLPVFPAMTDDMVDEVIEAVKRIVRE
ncbi:MAG: UDP-4-amino-4,6-dideoxy-N-acetyl-beta-L-altrosamine transaminase [Syntrophorhabdus sp.]|nr:UDP-4-amino-4,6-dideoxy-N-acetyl-beta-L-altrosamine transaminase [Syntrophorhabdus sp.]